MSVKWDFSPWTPIRGIVTYLKMVVGMAAVAGAIGGNFYARGGRSEPEINSLMGEYPDSIIPGAELVFDLFRYTAQAFATFAYDYLFWIPGPVFGLLVIVSIAYFGIYRVGEKGWFP